MNSVSNAPLSATQIMGIDAPRKQAHDNNAVREALPFAYVAAGFCAFFATLYVPEWYWVIPYYFLTLFGASHALLVILSRRQQI